MMDASALQADIRASGCASTAATIACVGITTCDRPLQLRRCLRSYAKHLRAYGRVVEFAVVDDSRDTVSRDVSREWLRTFALRHHSNIYYAGLEEKLEYVQKLSDEGISREVVQFMLSNPLGLPSSPGGNRNALLLHAAAEPFLSCDDDSVGHVRDLRCGRQVPEVIQFHAAAENLAFIAPNQKGAMRPYPVFRRDLIAAHEELLGRSLSDVFLPIRNTSRVRAREIGSSFLADLLTGKKRIAVTVSGLIGDSGLPDSGQLLTVTGEPRARFHQVWESEGTLDSCRSVVLGVARPTVSLRGPVRTTTATAFDNRSLLPPFMPSGRGEDTLFGALLTRSFDDVLIGHIPAAPLHAPRCLRSVRGLPTAPRLADLLGFFLEACPGMLSCSREERLRAVGRYLMECGAADPSDFQGFVLHRARVWLGAQIEQCEHVLDLYQGQPAEWASTLKNWISALEARLLSGDGCLQGDFPGPGAGASARYAYIQNFVLQFGRALNWWPEIVCAARRLKSNGHRLGRLLTST